MAATYSGKIKPERVVWLFFFGEMSVMKISNDKQRSQVARKTTLVSVMVNLFLSSFQILAGIFSGSQGLIADGIHSLSDLVADFVVLLANKKSGKPSDSDHHYGHRRYENGASLVIGALLLLVGAGMLWSACGKLLQPESIQSVHITALWVALAALTAGSLLQKRVRAAPADVLPLQNAIGLALCVAIVPFRPVSFDMSWAFVIPLLWLGIVISVIAQLLFYRLMQRGDLVNVTSLFYLVPVVTTLMDAVWLGNRPEPLALAGMGAIIAGLALVFRAPATRVQPDRA